jgi:hypothetical protein
MRNLYLGGFSSGLCACNFFREASPKGNFGFNATPLSLSPIPDRIRELRANGGQAIPCRCPLSNAQDQVSYLLAIHSGEERL